MAAKIFNILFGAIYSIAQLFLLPVNLLIDTMFPNLTDSIQAVITGINLFLSDGLRWGFNLLPPMSQTLVLTYLSFLVVYYTISIGVSQITRVLNVLKKMPLT